MELAWSELDLLLRGTPMGVSDGHLSSTVAYVWAYASRVFQPPDERVCAAIGRFDDVRLMLSAAQNFQLNAGNLPAAAQRALKDAFEARLPILERHPHVSAEALRDLKNRLPLSLLMTRDREGSCAVAALLVTMRAAGSRRDQNLEAARLIGWPT